MDHQTKDRASLAIARAIARELPARPDWIQRAKDNLDRWEARNAGTPSLVACYREWRQILNRPVDDVVAIFTAPTDEGQRLRQNTPFTGTLPLETIAEIRRRVVDGSLTV